MPKREKRPLRPLTSSQMDALEGVADNGPDAAVIGWDTAVSGPLLTLDRRESTGPFIAISPRGRHIPRERGNVL